MIGWIIAGVAALALKNKIAPSSPSSAPASSSGTTTVPLGAGSPVPASWPKAQSYFQRDANGNLLAVWGWNGSAWVNLTSGSNLTSPSTIFNYEVAQARRLLPVTPAFGFGAPTLYNPSSGIAVSAPSGTQGGSGGGGVPGVGGSSGGGHGIVT